MIAAGMPLPITSAITTWKSSPTRVPVEEVAAHGGRGQADAGDVVAGQVRDACAAAGCAAARRPGRARRCGPARSPRSRPARAGSPAGCSSSVRARVSTMQSEPTAGAARRVQRLAGVEPDAALGGHAGGYDAKRGSWTGSVTTSASSPRMVWSHIEADRGTSSRCAEADLGLVPLPVLVDQADHRHRHVEHPLGEPDQPVEPLLAGGVEDVAGQPGPAGVSPRSVRPSCSFRGQAR